MACQIALGRESVAGLVGALIERRLQVKVDLMMKRNGAGSEQERCSRQVAPQATDANDADHDSGLSGPRLLITL